MEERIESKRRLLYVQLNYHGVASVPFQDSVLKKIDELDKYGYLEHFRTKKDKPYFVWWGERCGYNYTAFKIRVKSPYDIDMITHVLKSIDGVTEVYTSWFPSRHDYGGIIQSDGTLIETWDI